MRRPLPKDLKILGSKLIKCYEIGESAFERNLPLTRYKSYLWAGIAWPFYCQLRSQLPLY